MPNIIPWWRTTFGEPEISRLRDAVSHEHVGMGPVTEEFERRIAHMMGVPYAVATTSGSAALYVALMAVGVGPGDEVIVPDRTWIATAHAVLLTGARCVLCDVEEYRPVMDMEDLRRCITPKTKAVVPVHLNGRATNMDALLTMAREHGLRVVEDACQAMFSNDAKGRCLGAIGDVGCFSLGLTKLISSGQGGFIVTRDAAVHAKLKLVRNHGIVDLFTDTWNQLGFNFKFTDLQASFAVAQLDRITARADHLRTLFRRYKTLLQDVGDLRCVRVDSDRGELPLYVEFATPRRSALVEYLRIAGVQTRPVPPSLHTCSYLGSGRSYPNSAKLGAESLYLPSGPEQPVENVETVASAIRGFYSS
jgi:dTDP-4-amino-4,6-dideoxygalactose transaminase